MILENVRDCGASLSDVWQCAFVSFGPISEVYYSIGYCSGARKHYNMRSALADYFLNAHNVLCMSGAAQVTVDAYKYSRTFTSSMWGLPQI